MKNFFKYLTTILFLLFLYLGLILDLPAMKGALSGSLSYFRDLRFKEGITAFETDLNDSFFCKLQAVDVDGLFRKALGQKIVRDAVLDGNGQLHGAGTLKHSPDAWDRETEDRGIAYTRRIIRKAQELGASVVFVQTPVKFNPATTPMPYDFYSLEWEIADYWMEQLSSEEGCPILDFRDPAYGADRFYNTDHHWTVESAFRASGAILRELDRQSPLEGLDAVTDPTQFRQLSYPDSLLGSFGVRTGKYFAGKDDMIIPVPRDPGMYSLTARDLDRQVLFTHSGSFTDAFLDLDILEDPGYCNKYGAILYSAQIENILRNENAPNAKRALLMGNSFTRPLACYLSTAFEELRTLDLQAARYSRSAISYMEQYRPEVVVVCYSIGLTQMTD